MISKLLSTGRRVVRMSALAALVFALVLILDAVLLRDDEDGPVAADPD